MIRPILPRGRSASIGGPSDAPQVHLFGTLFSCLFPCDCRVALLPAGPVLVALAMVSTAVGCKGGEGAPPPVPSSSVPSSSEKTADGPRVAQKKVELPLQHTVAQGQLGPGRGHLLVDLQAPPQAKLTLDAPASAQGRAGMGLSFPQPIQGTLGELELPLRIPVLVEDGASGPAELEVSYYWCGEDAKATCRRESVRLSIGLDLTGDSPGGEAHLAYRAQGE